MALSLAALPPQLCAYPPAGLAPNGLKLPRPIGLALAGRETTLAARASGNRVSRIRSPETTAVVVSERHCLRRKGLIALERCSPEVEITGGYRATYQGHARGVAIRASASSGDAAASSSTGESGGDVVGGGESVTELKQQLLRAVGGTQRGKAASPQQRQRILQLIERLEALNPTPSPMQSPLLAGTWALVYIAPTAASSNTLDASEEGPFLARVKPMALGGVRQRASLQIIHPKEGKAENVALFTAWGLDGELRIDAECRAPEEESQSGVRSLVRFLSFHLSLGPIRFTLPLSLISPTGWIDVTYIDEEMRVTRGDKGSVFLATRVKA